MRRTLLLLSLLSVTAMTHAGGLVRILFIGNSHTYVNDVPGTVRELAASAGYVMDAEMSAVGGYSLQDHLGFQPTLDWISRGNWDYVVLQEQSQIPTIPFWRDSSMFPSACSLAHLIRSVGAVPMLYITWGWRDGGVMVYNGDSSQNFSDYFEMQDTVTAAYLRLASAAGAGWLPAGPAFRYAREIDSLVGLWQADACHATPMGSYLAACVFFSHFYNRPATGLYIAPGVTIDEAVFCWDVSWHVVSSLAEAGPSRAPDPELEVIPNPCRLGRPVALRLAPGNPARVDVFDCQGRLNRTVLEPLAGQLTLTDLPPGTWFLRAGRSTGRITIIP
jgi:hypothetical protein